MIVGELYTKNGQANRLCNMRSEPTLPPGCVELVAMPTGFGPWAYDAPTKTAVPAALVETEKVDRLDVPPRVIFANAFLALPATDTTPGERVWARAILLDARDRLRAVRGSS